MIGCTKLPYLGEGYRLDYSGRGNYILVDNYQNTVVIGDHILAYDFDSTFIVVAQRPRDSVPECLYLKGEKFKDCEKAFKKSTFRQYWIINKRKQLIFDEKTKTYSNVYGPYNKEKYLEKLKKLNINKKFILKE